MFKALSIILSREQRNVKIAGPARFVSVGGEKEDISEEELFGGFFKYFIQHCLSDATVPEDAGTEPRTVVTLALAARRFNHSARSQDLIHNRLDLNRNIN